MTTLYFVRHGQSEANVHRVFAGSWDAPLTALGREQAACTAAYLADKPISAVYASDLQRAADTGAAVSSVKAIPLRTTRLLREIRAGAWEGKCFNELQKDPAYTVWLRTIGLARCTDGESVAQLQQRIRTVVEDIVRAHPDEHICIATHATPIRAMEAVWTNTPLEQMHTIPWVSNASVTIAEYDDDGVGRLVSRDINEHMGRLQSVLPSNV